MMLYPDVFSLIRGEGKCRYSLTLAIAKKARIISDKSDDAGETLTEKPVSLAIDCLSKGQMDYRELKSVKTAMVDLDYKFTAPISFAGDDGSN